MMNIAFGRIKWLHLLRYLCCRFIIGVIIMEKALLNLKEFCEYLGIGQTKAREILTKTENNFTVRIGNRLYVNKRQLDKWLMNISGNHVDKVRGNRRWERTIKEKNLEHISWQSIMGSEG